MNVLISIQINLTLIEKQNYIHLLYIFSNLKYEVIILKKIHRVPTGAKLRKEKEKSC